MEHCAPMCEDQVDYVTSKFHALQPIWQAMDAVLAKLQEERESWNPLYHRCTEIVINLGGKTFSGKFLVISRKLLPILEKLTYYIVPTGTQKRQTEDCILVFRVKNHPDCLW